MKPVIDSTSFGMISIGGETYEHDLLIRLDGTVHKRKKKLSSEIYGTAHIVSLEEARNLYEEGAERLVIGSGQEGVLELSKEAAEHFRKHGCQVDISPTPQAIRTWNKAQGRVIGMFHVTC